MGWFCLLWTILFAVNVSCQELTTLLPQDDDACMRNEVTFTCTVRGSLTLTELILAWSSPEYIGQGDPLRFTTQDMPGANNMSSRVNRNVTAILINNTRINEVPKLVSELHIVGAHQTSVITCTSELNRTSMRTTFISSAFPGRPQGGEARERSAGSCDFLVKWDPPTNIDRSDIDRYIIYVSSRNIMNVSSSNTIDLTVPSCRVGNNSIQVAAVNRFGCVGPNLTSIQLTLLEMPPTTSQIGAGAIAGIVIGAAFILCYLCASLGYILWRKLHPSSKELLPGHRSLAVTDHRSLTDDPGFLNEFHDLRITDVNKAKEDYQKQSKYDVGDLGTEKNRVSVPIWIDDELDDTWKASLQKAVKAINKAAPGLSLSKIKDKKQAIIHVLPIDEMEAYTERDIQVRFTPEQADYITKIHLGKLEDNTKEGISTRELIHALGFRAADSLGLARFDSLSITLYQNKPAYDSAQKKYPGDPVWRLQKNPVEKNSRLSELDKISLNLVYCPCRDTKARNARYRPELGKTGLYYCGRRVMSGHTYPGENSIDGLCGPNDGPNCPACRTIKNKKVDEIVAKEKWQGMTGRVYCGRLFFKPERINNHRDGICGMNNGPACPECNELLNKEI